MLLTLFLPHWPHLLSTFCWINVLICTSNYGCFPNLVVLFVFCLCQWWELFKKLQMLSHIQYLLSQNFCNLFSPHFDPNLKGLESVKSQEINRPWFWREMISRGWRLTFLIDGQLQSVAMSKGSLGWVPFISSVISITTPTSPKFLKIIILYGNWYFC